MKNTSDYCEVCVQIINSQFGPAWIDLLGRLYNSDEVNPRGMKCREQIGVTLRVTDAHCNIFEHPARKLNYKFMVAEWLWIWFGKEDVASIAQYNKEIAKFSDNGQTFDGAYGPRVSGQWPFVVSSLRRDMDTRQAVISIFQARRPEDQSKDVPCTLTVQFLYRYNRLNAIVCMRSSDVWLGLPYDFFNFSMLLNILAGQLGVPVGSMIMHLGSSHLYDRNVEAASQVLASAEVLHCIESPYLGGCPSESLRVKFEDPTAPRPIVEPWNRYGEVLEAPSGRAAFSILEK